jgi:predicted HTH transcriptional regulator
MLKYKVFISSVQSEFAQERQRIFDFIRTDELMGQYFEPFIFEQIAAQDKNPRQLYLDEASSCQVYLLLIGKKYGNLLPEGISPTEKEYQAAGEGNAWRVAFISDLDGQQREEEEERFFRKVQNELSYRVFSNPSVLISLVKQSLYAYLKYKGIIQTLSFDEQTRDDASMADIDAKKIKDFLHQARQKRGFPLPEDSDPMTVLKHLRLLRQDKPSNGALLMFANDPQYFFPSAVVKCAWFLGTEMVKPIEDYKTFEGNVAEQISQATSWVMSKLSVRFGQRNEEAQNEVEFEIPRSVIFETIVNAVAHRDYNSTGSVQVSVFRNRIVVRNPGTLPVELTKADLMKEHGSYPHNPYLAEVMYQMGYIEKYGTGITENIRKMQEAHLLAPEIDLSAEFITTIWRDNDATNIGTNDATNNATNIEANRLIDNATSGVDIGTNIGTNIGTSSNNIVTDHLVENKRIVDRIVKKKVKSRMTKEQMRECIVEVCIVDHSIDELATLLKKSPDYLLNFVIPELVADGTLLRTKPSHSPGQTYMTNPKLDK